MLRPTLVRSFHHSSTRLGTLGIRSEDPSRIWERRAPLTPKAVARLIKNGGHKVLVMPSEKRCFRDEEYTAVGAKVTTDISSTSDVIIGIKEIPRTSLMPAPSESSKSPTYLFFSHTHKGQSYNLPLLSTMIASQARYLDWELLTAPSTSKDGQVKLERTTAFGRFAGFAAMADGLSALGTKLLASRGVDTSLIRLIRPVASTGIEELKEGLNKAGKEWKGGEGTGVVTVVLAGRGRVGNGAREVLDALGVEWTDLKGLKQVVGNGNKNKIYACHLELSDYLRHVDGKRFDREEYRRDPAKFVSVFDSEVAPYTTVFFNGAYWSPGCPRILSTAQLASIQTSGPPERMLSIIDAACDFDGALEFVKAATTIDDPVIQFDASSGEVSRNPSRKATTQISAVEIYPATLPRDASEHFSSSIAPYVEALLNDPKTRDLKENDEIAKSLKRATLVEHGKLTRDHQHLYEALKGVTTTSNRKKVVLLGSGLVAGPAVRTLAARQDLDVIVASNDIKAARDLAKGHANVEAVALDATRDGVLEQLVSSADVVLSLLPAPLHVGIAELCIKGSTSLVTASYVSPEMAALQSKAASAGITILPELGLDPGIDHASGCRLIKEAQESGNKITSFVSFCGGLPSPELSGGPLGYKFSWSPRGVLTAALNSASFRLNGQDRSIAGADLLRSNFPKVPILPGFSLEGVANRDSLSYLEQYGLPKDLPTILRGTLRYPGFSRLVDGFKRLGLLSLEKLEAVPVRWNAFLDTVLAEKGYKSIKSREERIEAISEVFQGDRELANDVLVALEELSLAPTPEQTVAEAQTLPMIPNELSSPLDLLSVVLGHKLAYTPKERDAVLLHHELCTENEKTGEIELFSSTLVQYGDSKASAMATTVGVPIAIGALLILDQKVTQKGIVTPSNPQVWEPLLLELEKVGVTTVEKRKKGVGRGILEELK